MQTIKKNWRIAIRRKAGSHHPQMAFCCHSQANRLLEDPANLIVRLVASATIHFNALLFAALILQAAIGPTAAGASEPVSFVNDVVPIFTRLGCNAGVCHAKAGGGQNGFQLSLLGFEPQEDFEHLVREGRGRRLFPAAPEKSLLLQKVSGQLPHGGGVRIEPNSASYNLLRAWIEQGTKYSTGKEVELTAIHTEPAQATLPPGSKQQLRAFATYSDGSRRDVTQLALFESNDQGMADVSATGEVTAFDVPGRVAVMVRYQAKVSVFDAAIPLGAPVPVVPPSNNFIDDLVFANLQAIGVPPSPVCDDATFLRRVSLDIAGRVPTDVEVQAFLVDASPDKRSSAIDRLLRSPGYADYFANKWTALLKNRRDDASDITSNFAFHAWIRDSLLANSPYDQLVRELLAATGTVISNPPVAWYKRVNEPKQQIEDVAQLFLGVRMQCAQCHHHPFERWSQNDYYGLTAFFSQVGRKPTDTRGEDLIFHQRGLAQSINMKTGLSIKPAALGDDVGDIPPDDDPRLRLANWMSQPDNPFFAKALVNRYWKHFFRRGLIEPEDDIRDTNPPTNPELLAALEEHFQKSKFDLKDLVRVITNSNAYQLSAIPNQHNARDRQNYSRYYPKRLQAEVMLDAIDQLTGATTTFANLPAGTRAIALPDNSYNKSSAFLRVFGRPESTSVCECERVQAGSLAQSLHLINAQEIKTKLATSGGRAARLAADTRPLDERITDLYLSSLSRPPNDDELKIAAAYLAEPRFAASGEPLNETQTKVENFQDLVWALMNTKEFLFNH
jgi:hypothetical protein